MHGSGLADLDARAEPAAPRPKPWYYSTRSATSPPGLGLGEQSLYGGSRRHGDTWGGVWGRNCFPPPSPQWAHTGCLDPLCTLTTNKADTFGPHKSVKMRGIGAMQLWVVRLGLHQRLAPHKAVWAWMPPLDDAVEP